MKRKLDIGVDITFGTPCPFKSGDVIEIGMLTRWHRFTDRLRWLVGMKELYRFKLINLTKKEG